MKKKIAMLLSSLLVVSMLSGCGSEAAANTESNTTQEAVTKIHRRLRSRRQNR